MSISGVEQSYYQSIIATTKKSTKSVNSMEETGSAQELSEAEKLKAFKKEMWKEINSLSWGSSVSIQITDEAFEKMMNDSEFKNKMMNLIREDSRGSHNMCGGTLININENGYSGYSYMADHAKEANAAYESHSKDSFYSKKVKNQNADDIWEEKLLERERQQELRNKEYFQHREMTEYWNKRQSAAASYDANVMTETAAGSDSLIV
ncbi:MAG: hypothetical protein HDQ97_02020 [Lachnospiraceae bacterium]|nr:hypothetical protein [Lachnospiraceae bacterium]